MLRQMVSQKRRIKKTVKERGDGSKRDEDSEGEEEDEHKESEEEEGSEEESGSEEAEEQGEKEDKDTEELEPWHEWVQRTTRVAIHEMEKAQVSDWAEAARRSIWTLAGHISRRTDQRWSTSILDWEPAGGKRNVGKPLKRWSDSIEEYTAAQADELQPELAEPGYWRLLAEDRSGWKDFGLKFWHEPAPAKEGKAKRGACPGQQAPK